MGVHELELELTAVSTLDSDVESLLDILGVDLQDLNLTNSLRMASCVSLLELNRDGVMIIASVLDQEALDLVVLASDQGDPI